MFNNKEGIYICNPLFSFKSTSNWRRDPFKPIGYSIEVGYNEDYCEGEENEYGQYCVLWYELYDDEHLNSLHRDEDVPLFISERKRTETKCKVFNISKENYMELESIISKHSDLISVNTHLYNRVCDGSHEEIHFECKDFNRTVDGDIIMHFISIEDLRYDVSELDLKNARQSNVVALACKEIFDALKKYGVNFNEDED